MNILAIDPGTTESAFLCWTGKRILFKDIVKNEDLLDRMSIRVIADPEIIDPTPTVLAVEMIASYGMSVGAEVFETCVWIGRFIQAWVSNRTGDDVDLEWKKVYRRECKMHLCGTSKAKDANIRQALIDRFGPPGVKKSPGILYGVHSHEWAALAVAVTAHDLLSAPKQELLIKT